MSRTLNRLVKELRLIGAQKKRHGLSIRIKGRPSAAIVIGDRELGVAGDLETLAREVGRRPIRAGWRQTTCAAALRLLTRELRVAPAHEHGVPISAQEASRLADAFATAVGASERSTELAYVGRLLGVPPHRGAAPGAGQPDSTLVDGLAVVLVGDRRIGLFWLVREFSETVG